MSTLTTHVIFIKELFGHIKPCHSKQTNKMTIRQNYLLTEEFTTAIFHVTKILAS